MSKFLRKIDSRYMAAAARFRRQNGVRHVMAYVEGYDDIAFWRGVLSSYETSELRFEINVPSRGDLAKGKKVLLKMTESCGENLILCMDSDFDYIFGKRSEAGRLLEESPYMFQTYTYSIENYLCYPGQLRDACVTATKNDSYLFDFEKFMAGYSRVIYPLFLWYVVSAFSRREHVLPLADFREAVKLNFLVVEDDGRATLEWLSGKVDRKVDTLESRHGEMLARLDEIEQMLHSRGVTKENTFLYMQGHTIFDYVVSVVCRTVCEALKVMNIERIRSSSRRGVQLDNEMRSYKNSQRNVMEVLFDSRLYTECPLYKRLEADIAHFIEITTTD